MNNPFLALTQTLDGWQAIFAFQIFHRRGEDWMKMRWGFNAGVLLEEALDRQKLFVESQAASDAEFRAGIQSVRMLALRGMNLPGLGLQMAVLGKTSATTQDETQHNAMSFAREIQSTFPHDFIVVPAETQQDYQRLAGHDLLFARADVAQIQRGLALLPSPISQRFPGLWQASSRSNEQIWRALSAMPVQSVFNVLIQPTFLYEAEKNLLLDLRSQISNVAQGTDMKSAILPWVETIIKRRLSSWKKFFLLQVQVLAESVVDESLLRSFGSALTRDTNDVPLPGFQINRPDSEVMTETWRQNTLAMDFIPASRLEDLVDSDEAYAVFRFPYRHEAGLPGANFIEYQQPSPQVQSGQGP